MFRIIVSIFFAVCANNLCAQYFNNVNNELCYELYRTNDALSEFRVYIVIDKETIEPEDTVLLTQWHKISKSEQIKIVQEWALRGRRIEAERAPYITKTPKFDKPIRNVEMKRDTQKIDWDNSPWKDAKKFWLYPDRPF
jgi:hypothetical protein